MVLKPLQEKDVWDLRAQDNSKEIMPIFSYYGGKNMCFVGGRMAKRAVAEEHFDADSNLNEDEQNYSKRKPDLTEARN
uniref:Uncharacterized protein n=1 Tax=Glossina austeni TaxID=7395 RepID=A0A1A9V1D1_GLOAU